jgi:Cu/Ag efflux pump CusA
VVVYGTPATRHSVTSLQDLLIDTPSGGHVMLKDVANVRIVPAVTEIHRDAVARRIDVTASVNGRDLAAVAADIEEGLRQVDFPLEYRAELLGEYAVRQQAQQRVLAFAIAGGICIFLLLQAYFRSWTLASLVFVSLPAALTGGVVAILATGGGIVSFGSIVGLIAVLGMAVRNTLLLVGRYQYLEQQGETFGASLVARGTEERSGAILMSAIATALAVSPFAFFGNIAGLEIAQPLAIAVLGGLVSTTLLTLAGVPAMSVVCGAVEAEPDMELADDVTATAAA